MICTSVTHLVEFILGISLTAKRSDLVLLGLLSRFKYDENMIENADE